MGLYKCHVPEAEGENQLSNSPNGTSCCDKQLAFTFHYRPPTKFAKVMFSQMSVCPQWGSRDLSPGGSLSRGVSVPGGGGALREAPVEYWMCFEWNKCGCTYVHWRIYSSRYLDTSLYKVELELNMHWKNAGLYTLATKDWVMWELLLGANWQVRINRITMPWETVTWVN